MKYRKKPIIIEATQWLRHNDDRPEDETVRYYRHPEHNGRDLCPHCGKILHIHGWIDTLEGGHIVCPGDYIITGIKGEVYPCKPDIFKEYEEA